MGRRKTEKVIFEDVALTDTSAEGLAVGRVEGQVLFVRGGVPGDVADVEVIKRKRRYYEGSVIRLKKPSIWRTDPKCPHFGVCGGCKWQNMSYEKQLWFKQKQVAEAFSRIGGLTYPDLLPVKGSPRIYHYRNKLEFTFSNRRWVTDYSKALDFSELDMNGLGFHIPGRFDRVLDLETCLLQPAPSDDIRNFVKRYATQHQLSFYDVRNWEGLLRNLMVRNNLKGEFMVVLVVRHEDEAVLPLLEALQQEFPQIVSLWWVINPKKNDTLYDLEFRHFSGEAFLTEEMEGLKFRISPLSFYQTNPEQALTLYRVAREFAGLTGKETVYDLYSGTGTIAQFLASSAGKVVGVESVADAVQDAIENARLNNIENVHFETGDMVSVFNPEFIKIHGRPDVVVTDPPRAGMHPEVVRRLVETAPERIVYVSCNPSTQARDLALMVEKYDIRAVQPVDMFPQTHHIENVVRLELKS
ncbi:MAG: 23S rRNA (uracil(1939)-C(5))-methyltransferase RlmD [Bacteroidales bacterium]